MKQCVSRVRAKLTPRAALAAGMVGLLGCGGQTISDNYPPIFALVYGAVRASSGAPIVDAPIRAGDGGGVRTDASGRFRQVATLHGIGAGTNALDIWVYRTGPNGGVEDSVGVNVVVTFFPAMPPSDSIRVDLVTPWEP